MNGLKKIICWVLMVVAAQSAFSESIISAPMLEALRGGGFEVSSHDVNDGSGSFIVTPTHGKGKVAIYFQKTENQNEAKKVYVEIAASIAQGIKAAPFSMGSQITWASMGGSWSVVILFDNGVLSMNAVESASPQLAEIIAKIFEERFFR
jgi:hypothetical protein